MTSKFKPILSVDFDGVLHSYTSGWQGANVVSDPPVRGALDFLVRAMGKFDVHIYSSRSNQPGGIEAMKRWLAKHALEQSTTRLRVLMRDLKFPTEKPPALVGIDDRVITFTGKWPTIESLLAFKPWNKKDV